LGAALATHQPAQQRAQPVALAAHLPATLLALARQQLQQNARVGILLLRLRLATATQRRA
jgi:hypothetical protein